MEEIVCIKDDAEQRIFVNSNLTEMDFGKTKFSLLLDENGIFAQKDENNNFSFSQWKFDLTKTKDEFVFFDGKLPFSKKTETISSILVEANNGENEQNIAKKFCSFW